MARKRTEDGLDGVLVLDKPRGPSSHDLVEAVRRGLHTRRVGHTGTLDPFATGVLGICVGRATRLARFLGGEKAYEATARLGWTTDTDDETGRPASEAREATANLEQIRTEAARFVGEILQRPPAFSAKHVSGQRSYELARRGVSVEIPPVLVRIESLEILSLEGASLRFTLTCSPGTYVRALARDLGEALGCGAHLSQLRRTRSGTLGLERAVAVTSRSLDPQALSAGLLTMDEALSHFSAIELGSAAAERVRHGGEVVAAPGTALEPGALVRLRDASGTLLAVARARSRVLLQPEVVLAGC